MITTGVNLIPDQRQAAGRLARRIRAWVVGTSVFGGVLLVGCSALRLAWNDSDPRLASAMALVETQIGEVNDTIDQIRSKLGQYQSILRANRDLIEHPDWGLLLGLLARSLGDDLVLRECRIHQIGTAGANRASDSDHTAVARVNDAPLSQRSFRLAIRGMGQSQAAVSQFALRLENTGLFGGVKLVDTSLDPYLTGKAVSFHVVCQLGSSGGGQP